MVSAMLAVIFGAFGAHQIKSVISPSMLEIWHTAVEYQFYHSLALILCGILSMSNLNVRPISPALFFTGILFFSGSLFLIVLLSVHGAAPRLIGILTPLGGVCFIAGWLSLIFLRPVNKA